MQKVSYALKDLYSWLDNMVRCPRLLAASADASEPSEHLSTDLMSCAGVHNVCCRLRTLPLGMTAHDSGSMSCPDVGVLLRAGGVVRDGAAAGLGHVHTAGAHLAEGPNSIPAADSLTFVVQTSCR
jgi:hypothetical protein